MSKLYSCLPSVVLGIKDNYTAYCFNEACSYILLKLREGEEIKAGKSLENKTYSSFSDLYKNLGK